MDGERTFILALDQGTTSTRAILFDRAMQPVGSHAIELRQSYPADGWVEHDPEEIVESARACCRAAAQGVSPEEIAAIGIANQRETVVLWDRATGRALANAIVWQDRRTADLCRKLKAEDHEARVAARTGLLLDPYFSATKIAWLLDNIPGARSRAEAGALAWGTIDSWLVWHLTGGRVHATDATNASRTLLMNLRTLKWDEDMLALFGIPRALLPEIRACTSGFGEAKEIWPGARVPIRGVAGDQQAAAFGQACFAQGDIKATFGTGCFVLAQTGRAVLSSDNRLLATVAWQVENDTAYALEGSVFVAGSVVQWLRDLGVIRASQEIEALARQAKDAPGLYFVPAFTGLGAPYWDPDARGAIVGLTRDTGAAEIARAALDAVCFQTRDLLEAMARDAGGHAPTRLKIDGGMARNDDFCQRLADLTGSPVERPRIVESTALGAACFAALGCGLFHDPGAVEQARKIDRRFDPKMPRECRDRLYDGWNDAVRSTRSRLRP